MSAQVPVTCASTLENLEQYARDCLWKRNYQSYIIDASKCIRCFQIRKSLSSTKCVRVI